MSTKTERKRRRQAERLAELGWATRVRRRIPFGRIAIVAAVLAATVGGVFLISRASGKDSAKLIAPVPATGAGEGASVGVRQGQLAPNFEATDLAGKRVRLSDLRGKVVMLNFYASWCTGCQAEIPAIQTVWERYRDRGFEVLGVNDGETRSVAVDFLQGTGGQYSGVIDPDQTIVNRYRVRGLPVSVFVGRDGIVKYHADGELRESDIDSIVKTILGQTNQAPAAAVTPVGTPAVR